MADSYVTQEKQKSLAAWMSRLGLCEQDLEEKFILGSGKGGQKINKTSSCVCLRHVPTGLEVRCQRARSQALNRFFARREMCERLEARRLGAASRARQEAERIRRQKRRRSRRQKQRMLEEKHRQSERKASRARVPPSDRE
jgi:peptide chain release factor